MGLLAGILKPVKAETNLLTLYKDFSFKLILTWGIKSLITAATLAIGAFPALSPIPFTVRCNPLHPAFNASITLETLKS